MHCIHNEKIAVQIDSFGAQICSVKDGDGQEFLWQGNESSWNEHAPNLFPYIGRMTEKTYTYEGKSYHMNIHGFVKSMELLAEEKKTDSITFRLESSKETLQTYPFSFTYLVRYRLEGSKICIDYEVTNRDEKKMYFGIGGHPGFCVPYEKDTSFDDYYIEFEEGVNPKRIGFSEDCFVDGRIWEFELRQGRCLDLRHDLFDDDAIVLKDAGHAAELKCKKGTVSIRVEFPDMPFFGMWHSSKMEVDFLCMEPWSSLPSRKNVTEELSAQEDLIGLEPGGTYVNRWSIELKKNKD